MADKDLGGLQQEIFMDDETDEEDFVRFRLEEIHLRQQRYDHHDENDSIYVCFECYFSTASQLLNPKRFLSIIIFRHFYFFSY